MSEIYLIRHGVTRANLEHLYCGKTDLPLCEKGVEELRQKHYAIEDAAFFTSGMKRTEQTLRLLFGDVPHEQLPAFREIDFGIFEMHTYEDLKDDPAYQTWISGDNEANTPPGGESGADMTKRVIGAYRTFSAGEGRKVLITHGGVIAAIMSELFPDEGKNRYTWQPRPGCGYVIQNGTYTPIP